MWQWRGCPWLSTGTSALGSWDQMVCAYVCLAQQAEGTDSLGMVGGLG